MTVTTAKTYNIVYTASSVGATKNAIDAMLGQAVAAGDGSKTVVQTIHIEKTGQNYEMTLLVQ